MYVFMYELMFKFARGEVVLQLFCGSYMISERAVVTLPYSQNTLVLFKVSDTIII